VARRRVPDQRRDRELRRTRLLPRCGSRLLDTSAPGGTFVEIRIGSLDEAPFELKPEDEIWVKRRESWIPPVEGAAQHDEKAG